MVKEGSVSFNRFCEITLVLFCCAGSAQAAVISLVPTGPTTISPGQTIEVDLFLDAVPSPGLKVYQITLEVAPLAGSTGTLTLADASPPPNTSLFVDTSRADYVFFGLSDFAAVNVSRKQIGSILIPPGGAVFTTPKYLGTYVFVASGDADGNFLIDFVITSPTNPSIDITFLQFGPTGADPVPFTTTNLTVTASVGPGNDDCLDAATIGSGVTPFSTVNALTDGPALPISCDEGFGTAFEADIWYEHTATCTGLLTISTCDDATFNTRLAVYGDGTGTCTCPVDNTNFLACNDTGPGCSAGTAEVTLNSTAGECLTVRVGGSGATSGTGNLTIACIDNDTCATAKPLSVPSTTSGATLGAIANDNFGQPFCGAFIEELGVWYEVTGTGGLMSASLCSVATNFDTRLAVYEGACGASLTCVAGADDTCGEQESVSWCSTLGTVYRILVHGAPGEAGSFSLTMTNQSCNDGNACTDDSCTLGACLNEDFLTQADECCSPTTGTRLLIPDANPCTDDVCNADGSVSHPPVPNGPSLDCADEFNCTLDQCLSGACVNTDINSISCVNDVDCPDGNECVGNLCECFEAPIFELIPEPGVLPVAGCYATDDIITIHLEMSRTGDDIIGAQAALEYDTSTMVFQGISPGNVTDPTSPFRFEINESVDTFAGTIDYLVSVQFGDPGTRGPARLATLTFRALGECDPFLRFRASTPPSRLTTIDGFEVLPILMDMPAIHVNGSAPVLTTCPGDVSVVPDPGELTTSLAFTEPTSADSCDGVVVVECDPPSGFAFSAGTTGVTCTAVNSCGIESSCGFNVTVVPPTVTVDIELSPTMAPGPINRCITFDVWDCAAGVPLQGTVSQDVSFTNGVATGVVVAIPGGTWDCITATDPLHTLRSTAPDFATLDGISFTATFVGNRSLGGHWLVGGDLNNDQVSDILDFGIFFTQFLTPAQSDTFCNTALTRHADINGDGVVDLADFVFIQVNSLLLSEPNCCSGGTGAMVSGPLTAISIADLRKRGYADLIAADLNQDGMLDTADVMAFAQGVRPVMKPKRPKSARTVRSRLGSQSSR